MPFLQLPPHCLPPMIQTVSASKQQRRFLKHFPPLLLTGICFLKLAHFPVFDRPIPYFLLPVWIRLWALHCPPSAFCFWFASSFRLLARLVSAVFGSAGHLIFASIGEPNSHLSRHPWSWTSCIHIISCDWSPDMWETEMCCVPNFPSMKWPLDAIGL